MSRRAATLTVASVLVLALALVGSLMPVPYIALMPGPTSNTLGTNEKGQQVITIDGRRRPTAVDPLRRPADPRAP